MWQIPDASNPIFFDFRPSLVAHFLYGEHRQIPANHVDENLSVVLRHHSPNRLCCSLWWLVHCERILHARSNAWSVLAQCVSKDFLLSLWILRELEISTILKSTDNPVSQPSCAMLYKDTVCSLSDIRKAAWLRGHNSLLSDSMIITKKYFYRDVFGISYIIPCG